MTLLCVVSCVCCRLSEPEIQTVYDWIVRTATHMQGPATGDLAYFLDIDLSILGGDAATYTAYAESVRYEYHHYATPDFRTGRAAVGPHLISVCTCRLL